MSSKLSAIAARLAESSWLAAIVVVPIFFNIHSFRTFEEDKIPLLRSLAVVICVALVVRTLEDGRQAWRVAGRPMWRLPLVRPALLLTGAYLVSTIFSIAPHLSIWGSYERTQGIYTWLSYVTIFVGILLVVRSRAQVERIVTATLLASLPPAAYAIVQHFGYDPIRWGINVTERAHGTTGNPIFLSAFLIMVVPLTLVRLLEQLTPRHGPFSAATRRGSRARASTLAGAYTLLLAIQFLALIFSQSRGPFIGLFAGLAFFFIVFALQHHRRWLTMTVAALTVTGALFLIVFNTHHSPLAPLRDVRYVGTLGRLLETSQGTGRVRTVIWQGALELLAAHPLRDLIGYGPEALFLAYTPYYPPELARYESRRVAPDRAHNETFDALIMTGVLGCSAEIALFVLFFSCVLHRLGLLRTPSQRSVFFATAAAGGVAGTLLPYIATGSFRFAGVGLPVGIVAGLGTYVIAAAVRHRNQASRPPAPSSFLFIGLLAAVMAHFVEIQFGIAISATRLLFWIYAAAAVAAGVTVAGSEAAEPATLDGDHHSVSLAVALILILLTFDFYRPELNVRLAGVAVLSLFLGTWLFGALIAAVGPTGGGDRRSVPVRLRDYAALTLVGWLLFAAVYVLWLNWRPAQIPGLEDVVRVGWHLANTVALLYGAVLVVVLLHAAVSAHEPLPARRLSRHTWRLGVSALLVLGALPAIVFTNLHVSQADMFIKQIEFYSKRKRPDAALLVAQEALRLEPAVDQYATSVVRALMDLARTAPRDQPQTREAYLAQAAGVLQRARRTSPMNMDNTRNLARLHRLWSALATDPAEQTRHLDEAHGYYTQATQLSPNNASLWNEWALLYTERRRANEALPLLNHSLQIDDGYTTTYWLRANLYLETGALDAALADYERALAIDPKLLAAWSGKALALARLNRLDDAIAANQEALKLKPKDLISHRNLAVLYQRTDRPDLALQEARAALRVAKSATEKSALQDFIRQLGADPESK